MVTTCAARRVGISIGLWLWTTSHGPASHSTGGHPQRFHDQTNARTGTRRSITRTAGISRARDGGGRSFQELEKSTISSLEASESALAIPCTNSPTPVRSRRAGR